MSITSVTYPKIEKWYNSERREVVPAYMDTRGVANDITFYQSSCNKFTLDATGTDVNNKKNVTLFTFANGISIRMRYYKVNDDINYEVGYFDTNGNVINLDNTGSSQLRTWSTGTLYPSEKYSLTYSNYEIYYTPPQVTYTGSVTEEHPESYQYKGTIFHLKDNASPYDPPEIMGVNETYDRANLGTYYDGLGGGVAVIYTEEDFNLLNTLIIDSGDGTPISPILPSEDTSDPGGGDDANPDYNPFSDPIGFPDLPSGGSSIASGFIRVYAPTSTELQQLASVLWSDSFVNTLKKLHSSPMEAIISLHSIPFSVVGSNTECVIGNYNTEITMPAVSTQYYTLNLGSIYIPEHWASALDYSPYVTIDCYIPYCGVVQLQVDDIIGRTITIKMNVDILGGETLVSVLSGNSVLYTYNTNIISRHPLSQSSFGPFYQSIVGMLGSTASGLAMGGAGGAIGGAIGGAVNVALSKHHAVSRGGSIAGATGALGNFTPYLIIHRPIQSLASGFAHFKGYPSNITARLGSVSGYTEVESVHLNGITCTDNEKAEIEALLYNGVIL